MSFAPKDEHEAKVQMVLERWIPAISAIMGSKRLPFPSKSFDLVHCTRYRIPAPSPFHCASSQDLLLMMPRMLCPRAGGARLLELNRVLRPGGFFVWSATPVYQKLTEDVELCKGM
jgi:hypothetical protein